MVWLENEVAEYMKRQQMLSRFRRVYVGLSGGADSVCLLLVLKTLSAAEHFEVRAIHVHHHIRGAEADRDMEFCEELCRRLEVELTVVHVDVPTLAREQKESEELAARRARYAAFAQVAADPDAAVAVAHHRDDEDETMLLNLLRGSGLSGLCGMKPVRRMETEAGSLWVIRPLLCVSRAQIEAYLQECGQDYVTDSTNVKTDYTRNRIRHKVLPAMAEARGEEAESLSRTLTRLRGQLSQIETYMLQEAARFTDTHAVWENGSICVPVKGMKEQPEALQTYVVRDCIGRVRGGDLTNIEAVHVEDVCGLLSGQSGRQIVLPQGLKARRSFDRLVIGPDGKTDAAGGELLIRVFDGGLAFYKKNEEKIRHSVYTKWLDYDKMVTSFCLRTRRSGDRMVIGAGGEQKKLTRILMEAKIDAGLRDLWPVVADGDRVVWVCGYRIDEEYKITETTRRVAEVTLPAETAEWLKEQL